MPELPDGFNEALRTRWPRLPTWAVWIAGLVVLGIAGALVASVQQAVERVPERLAGPLDVRVSADYADFDAAYLGQPKWAFPAGAGGLTTPPGWDEPYAERQRWARELGGVPANVSVVQVVVSGNSDEPVVLTGLSIDVVTRSEPLDGPVVIYCECGDVIPERIVTIDLDRSPPAIDSSVDHRDWFVESSEAVEAPITFPYRVSRTEVELFYLFVKTGFPAGSDGCYCTWTASLHYSASDGNGSVTIDDHGEPFAVTAVPSDAPVLVSAEGEPLTPVDDYYDRTDQIGASEADA